MNIRPYLPSAQFSVLIAAVALSAGLVYAAERSTQPPSYAASIAAGGDLPADDTSWRQELLSLSGSSTPVDNSGDISTLLAKAQTKNLTESVGRTLLLNLSAAQGQGMSNDEPTQTSILSAALTQIASSSAPSYAATDLSVVADSPEALRAYGNGVMRAVNAHGQASYPRVAVAIGAAVDNRDASQAVVLSAAAADYRVLARDLSLLAAPASLESAHLRMVNNFAAEADAVSDMAAILPDPLRGLQGFQNYQARVADNISVFTALSAALSNNGIIFSASEPGSAWSTLHSP